MHRQMGSADAQGVPNYIEKCNEGEASLKQSVLLSLRGMNLIQYV